MEVNAGNSAAIAADLHRLAVSCDHRKLFSPNKWACEMLMSMPESEIEVEGDPYAGCSSSDARRLRFAYALIDSQEYLRAGHLTECWGKLGSPPKCDQPALLSFVHFYSRYLVHLQLQAGEKERLDGIADVLEREQSEASANSQLRPLLQTLTQLKALSDEDHSGPWDHFHAYLLGVVCEGLRLRDQAQASLLQAVRLEPSFWPAWLTLAKSVRTREALGEMELPEHWMKDLFLVEAHLGLQLAEDTLLVVERLEAQGSPLLNTDYLVGNIGAAKHLAMDCEGARESFRAIRERSPYRLDHMDDFANTLFVLAEKLDCARTELCALAKHCFRVDQFSPHTCFVLGNYYGIRNEHEKAVEYHQRAVRLDPSNSSAYILMGHEFMELKNTPAATIAYRQALDLNPKDFRAWYAMGTSYDLLQMPSYSAYYFMKAHKANNQAGLRPQDSRFLIALGDMVAAKGNKEDARACYWRAHCVGDMDGIALFKLAGALEEAGGRDAEAASCYWSYLKAAQQSTDREEENEAKCYQFLTQYAINQEKWDAALSYAQCCLQYPLTKNRGKHFLQLASEAKLRAMNMSDVPMDNGAKS